MAADDNAYTGSHRVEIEIVQTMQHIDGRAAKFHDFGFWESSANSSTVDISSNSGQPRDCSQGIEDRRVSHISGMENMIHAIQCGHGLGSQQTVRVRNDADSHGGSESDRQTSARIEIVAQRIADEVKGKDAEHDRQCRK